ncbi:MAG: FKBP-type peptidyl-prolyl cis-trans isomerase [Desulfurococcales archaeon]|nr:FKBP-type peptidyl-prolyl cis-trans isomerase [Desulfurococcales archaeon]
MPGEKEVEPLNDDNSVLVLHMTVKKKSDGSIVDTTIEEVGKEAGIEKSLFLPRTVIVGDLIEELREAVKHLEVGGKTEVEIPPEKAYGEKDESKIIRIPKKRLLKRGITPKVGTVIEDDKGNRGVITKVTERFAEIDFNHPLAGETLIYEIELVKKLEEPADIVKYLVADALYAKPDDLEVVLEEEVAKVFLPPAVLAGINEPTSETIRSLVYTAFTKIKKAIEELKGIDIIVQIKLVSEKKEEEKEAESKETKNEEET